ncbi:unnamed protein product [Rotaria sp. Silwood2]|nr:unnamed protein product [Rotaria sp. Silwood2]CAF3415476.1 unnamed protein product [Rotaria sp. Silwood2]
MIFIIVFLTISTHLHDPLLRRLVDDFDADEQRTWCFIQYSAFLDRWNSTITFLHFLVPFSSNLIGVIFMIISIARSRSQSQPKKTIREHFRHQMHKHKHLLMTPALLVLLSVPRLIIPFFTKCMKTPREPSLFLIGYFVSFVPATLPFFIFVLPSNEYKRNFRKAIQLFKRRFRCAP